MGSDVLLPTREQEIDPLLTAVSICSSSTTNGVPFQGSGTTRIRNGSLSESFKKRFQTLRATKLWQVLLSYCTR